MGSRLAKILSLLAASHLLSALFQMPETPRISGEGTCPHVKALFFIAPLVGIVSSLGWGAAQPAIQLICKHVLSH